MDQSAGLADDDAVAAIAGKPASVFLPKEGAQSAACLSGAAPGMGDVSGAKVGLNGTFGERRVRREDERARGTADLAGEISCNDADCEDQNAREDASTYGADGKAALLLAKAAARAAVLRRVARAVAQRCCDV